jgi:ubiquinone/menaquinone biosynthesis C-methylase UbiE
MGLYGFVTEQLPSAPARVLEVGCGRGDLARAIAESGYEVVAIDPDAPTGELFRATSLEEFADPEPFDAVVASLALHHVADLPGALDKIVSLLRPAGRLIVNEHAVDRLDEPTARWYLEKRAVIRPDAPARSSNAATTGKKTTPACTGTPRCARNSTGASPSGSSPGCPTSTASWPAP